MIFKGQLEVTANNKCWLYNVTQCVFDNVKISFDFDGVREGARYTGHCVAYLEGLQFKGVATFVVGRRMSWRLILYRFLKQLMTYSGLVM